MGSVEHDEEGDTGINGGRAHFGLKFDYQERTTQDNVRLRIRAVSNTWSCCSPSVQVDDLEHGWTSRAVSP